MILFWFVYALLIVLMLGLMHSFKVQNPQLQTYSILISCRNEEKNLPMLFTSLKQLDYPPEKYEIILVDDASNDKTYELIQEFCQNQKHAIGFRLDVKNEEYKGKKAALKLASEQAKYDFLLFTDADCLVPATWLHDYNPLIDNNIGAVIGFYLENSKSQFRRFMKLLNAGLFAATTGLGFPFSAAGGNFCVRKQTFREVGGYEKIKNAIAGDDKLLLNLIKQTNWKIGYNSSSVILTQPELSPDKRNNQLKRQYGKFGSFSFLFQTMILLTIMFYIYLPFSLLFSTVSFFYYYLLAFLFWLLNLKIHKQKFRNSDFLWLLIFPYIAIYYGILGTFTSWKWKGN
jgi:cellulose synthase/poly-beta-1,6-N-acetylglucosamine synthase-like glycosyltransferase